MVNTGTSCTDPECGHIVWIAAKVSNMILNPFESIPLINKPIIADQRRFELTVRIPSLLVTKIFGSSKS